MKQRPAPIVTPAVRLRAEALGAEGQRWLASLARTVVELEAEWGLSVGETLSGGSGAYVAAVRLKDGRKAVLKINMPAFEDLASETEVLRLAEGCGYARLYAYDAARRAALIERLGASLETMQLETATQIDILCGALKDCWMPAPSAARFQTGAEKARWLSEFITSSWQELGRPCTERTIALALAFAAERDAAFDPAASLVIHGDPHASNLLQVPGAAGTSAPRFKFIDPDGILAEPAYDLGVLMREWTGEFLEGDALTLGKARCALLHRLTGVDATAIWQWGLIERVSTGLLCTRLKYQPMGEDMLKVADIFAAG